MYDKTLAQLESEIGQALIDKGLVKQPWVQVQIRQRRAQAVYILGEVQMPGQFLIKDEMYLLDLITLAAGFNEFSTPVGYLYRRSPAPADSAATDEQPSRSGWTEEAIPLDFAKLMAGGEPELNLRLQGGDIVYVPERRKLHYYVVGEVARPGAFEYPQPSPQPTGQRSSDGPVRISEAVAKAGGPLRTAKTSAGLLVRLGTNGSLKETPVDVLRVLKGQQPDFPVEPNDIIFIPGSTAKSFGYSVLRIIPGLLIGSLVY